MKSYIYFIQEGLQGNIKIGISQNPNDRIKQLQTGSSTPLRTLLVKEGTQKDEEGLHKKFKKFQLKGEWFEPSEEILVYIEEEKEKKKNEKIVELENKVEHLTTENEKIVELGNNVELLTTNSTESLKELIRNTEIIIELEDKVELLTTEIDNLRNQTNRPIENHPTYYTSYQWVYVQRIDSIQTNENKKRIKDIRFLGICDRDLNFQRNGVNLVWEVDDDPYEFMLLSKIFDFDKIILKNKNIDNETSSGIGFDSDSFINVFFLEESNKNSIFDFISSKTFPFYHYTKGCFIYGCFHNMYNIEENLTYFTPKEVINPLPHEYPTNKTKQPPKKTT